MSNTDWKDETVQELKKGYMAMIMDRDERIAILTAGSEAMQEDARNNTATISAMKELLIKAESALTYANWDGEFSKQATAQDVISARDAIRAYMEVK